MKIISLLQPWAQLMVQGFKTVETRSWCPKYRGPVFIHASGELNKKMKNIGVSAYEMATSNKHFRKCIINPNKMVFGKIIGMVNILEVLKIGDNPPDAPYYYYITPQEVAFGNYQIGRYMFFCDQAVEFKKPIPVKGKLSITDYTGTTHCAHCDRGHIPSKDGIHVTPDQREVPCYNIRLI